MQNKQINKEVQKIKKELNVAIENNDVKTIFEYFDIEVKEDENGYLTISEYKQPSKLFSFKDLGIDENVLLEKVKVIEGSADFSFSRATNLSNLKSIGGNANFKKTQITNLGELKTIGGTVCLSKDLLPEVFKLTTVGEIITEENSYKSLDELKMEYPNIVESQTDTSQQKTESFVRNFGINL